jgi:hypothetical protein
MFVCVLRKCVQVNTEESLEGSGHYVFGAVEGLVNMRMTEHVCRSFVSLTSACALSKAIGHVSHYSGQPSRIAIEGSKDFDKLTAGTRVAAGRTVVIKHVVAAWMNSAT